MGLCVGGDNTVCVCVHVCVGVVGGRVIYHWTNAGLWGVLVEVGVRGVVGQNGAAPQMK